MLQVRKMPQGLHLSTDIILPSIQIQKSFMKAECILQVCSEKPIPHICGGYFLLVDRHFVM
jgi:hypothetical protein